MIRSIYYFLSDSANSNNLFFQCNLVTGKKNLMELDCPKRVASEVFNFIYETHKGFYK
jgi:hypothetical protein